MKTRVANLSQQLKALGTHLLRISGEISHREPSDYPRTAFAGFGRPKGAWLEVAKQVRSGRASRHDFFPSEFFGEPAWNILLELFIADLEGESMSVQDACLDSGVPATTALRYLGDLQAQDLLRRIADKTDRRRTYVKVTNKGRDLMRRYLARISSELAAVQTGFDAEAALIELDDDPNPT